MLIRRMKPLGYSLEKMSDLLRALDATRSETASGAEAMRLLAEFLTDAEQRRAKLEKQLAAADEFIGLLSDRIAQ